MLDLLLTHARIHTLSADRPTASRLGVVGGRIVGVDEELGGDPPAARTVHCGGAVVVPGFGDAHNHMLWFGRSQGELDLTTCTSPDEVYRRVHRASRDLAADRWLIGHGFDHEVLGGALHHEDLDRASGGRRVWLKHRSGHEGVASTRVLRDAGILAEPGRTVPGGTVIRDPGDAPSGGLQEAAMRLATDLIPPATRAELAAALARASAIYASEGLTHVTECGIGGGLVGRSPFEAGAYQEALRSGGLTVRVTLMPAADTLRRLGDPVGERPEVALDLGLHSGFGNDHLKLGAVKMWLDGSMLGKSAAISEPGYDDGCGCGYLAADPEEMKTLLVDAHRSGWQIAAHAIGDRAVDLAVDTLATAQRVHPRPDARHRIEHAGLVRPDQIRAMAEVGAVPVPQPRFLHEFGDAMATAVGPDRVDWLYRHRSFLEAGMRVPGSSDRPVASGAPLLGIRSMVERLSAAGRAIGADERVDVATALRAYTVDAAWVDHEEQLRGRLTRGRLADFVVLDADPLAVASRDLDGIRVLATFVGGRCVYAGDAAPVDPDVAPLTSVR
ncbi:amidohydrolase [Nocardioides sp. L-11A]|uniref:amidohydrolase n=1 Tax=Nocardioides sp. L-11A TaxID=3043848 RepID=UPI00249C2EB9|nr:amidohydrolase [Nocardioides sp. L-11A]